MHHTTDKRLRSEPVALHNLLVQKITLPRILQEGPTSFLAFANEVILLARQLSYGRQHFVLETRI